MHPPTTSGRLALPLLFALLTAATDAQELHLASTLEPLPGPVRRVYPSPDGLRLLTLGEDGRAILLDVATNRVLFCAEEFGENASVAWSNDAAVVALAPEWPATGGVVLVRSGDGRRLEPLAGTALELPRTDPAVPAEALRAPTLYRHESGALVLRSPGYRDRLGVGTGDTLDPAAFAAGAPWAVTQDGRRLLHVATSGVVGRADLDAEQTSRAAVLVEYELPSGRPRARGRFDDIARESDGFFPAALAWSGESLGVVRNGQLEVRDWPSLAVRGKIGSGITAVTTLAQALRPTSSPGGPPGSPPLEARASVVVGDRDGRLSIVQDGTRLARMAAVDGAVLRLRREAHGVVASTDRARHFVAPDGTIYGAPNAYEVRAAAGAVFMRDDDGGVVVRRPLAPPLHLRLDRPEYDEDDERCVRFAAAGPRLFGILQGSPIVVTFESGAATTASLGSHHRGRIRDFDVASDRAVVIGTRTRAVVDLVTARADLVHPGATPILAGDAVAMIEASSARRVPGHPPADLVPIRIQDAIVLVGTADGVERARYPLPGRAETPCAVAGEWLFAVATRDGEELHAVETRSGALRWRRAKPSPGGSIDGIATSRDGRFLALDADRGYLLDATNGEILATARAGPTRSRRLGTGFTADFWISASYDREVGFFDLAAGRPLARLDAPDETYSHFAEVSIPGSGTAYGLLYPERALLFLGRAGRPASIGRRIETAPGSDPIAWLDPDRAVVLEPGRLCLRVPDDGGVKSSLPLTGHAVAARGRHVVVGAGSRLHVVELR